MTQVAAPPSRPRRPDSVIIRPWPKVVFLYPTFLAALVFWFLSFLWAESPDKGAAGLGNWFCLIFFLNLIVFSFDFSRVKSITLLITVVAVALLIAWLNTKWQVVAGIDKALDAIDIRMNTQFYGWLAAFLALVFLLVLVNTRFNYYEVNSLEILHHHGYLGDITRMPTAGLRMHKEIYDLFEHLLLRSGRLVFYPSTSREAIVIDNVLSINRVEERIKDLLRVLTVSAEPTDGGMPDR
ncbi:MAG: hypothetical protein IT458_03830 [Planctomycetes bacterium]|nr:hypothetical protein [Planctomycetota bacterium]